MKGKNDMTENRKRISSALLVIICLFGSALFGFAGSYIANSINGMGTQSVVAAPPFKNTPQPQSAIQLASLHDAPVQMSIEEVVAKVRYSVVEVITEVTSANNRLQPFVRTGAGSGVIITSDGYIATNHHVVHGAGAIRVRLQDGTMHNATLVGTDAKTDLAIIKINATNLQPAIPADPQSVRVGQTAIAIGNPLGELGGTVTTGIISALDREILVDGAVMTLLQTDAAINPGNSGGGLFNIKGELVGIVNAKSSGVDIEGLGFAIPIDIVVYIIGQIKEYGFARGRIDTGFVLIDIQDIMTAWAYRVNQTGLYISASVDGQFLSGDRITAVNAHTVNNLTDFTKAIDSFSVGDVVDITISRDGRSLTLPLTLKELVGGV
jgi:serine protease Do